MNKSDSTMGSSGRRDCILKYLVGLLSLVALIFLSSFVYVMNSDPVLELKQCEKRLQNETFMLNECEQARGESQSLLNNCQAQSVALSENIVTLEKKLKDLELLNTNLNNEQEQLKDVLQHWEVKFSDLEEKQENQEEELNRATKRLDEKQREVEEWIENHSRLNQQLNKCWNQPVRYHGECSWFTVLIGIGGSCLGFGSCSNNKCS
ncbi:putative leucine-rich repeat-containing protein DDB_G0290503 [Heptranchias perlo]|uniref:putative leucine-rich repeat-containing protein DDB_G0290503 n=1 Tax=Heptranchias perlo TaxID=212740 RepID=UPI0035596658